MKIKEGLLLKEVAGNFIIVPVSGELVNLNAMITINETGAFLFKMLEKGADEEALISSLTKEYEVTETEAKSDVADFIEMLTKHSMLDR